MIPAYSRSVLMQTRRLCSPLDSWLTAQPTQAIWMVIQWLHGITSLSLSLVPIIIPNCFAYVHFCNTGEEQARWEAGEQHAARFNYYMERTIFLFF